MLWFFIAFNEELLSKLPIDCQEVWVEISSISSFWFIAPSSNILVGKGQLHWNIVFLFVHLQLLREWSLYSRLHLYNLRWIVFTIIKNLPFLDCSLVHFNFSFCDLFGPDFLFNHSLKFKYNILASMIIIQSTVLSVIILVESLIVRYLSTICRVVSGGIIFQL